MTKIIKVLEDVENISFVKAIRGGLVTVIPVLFVGSFSLVLRSLPISVYQQFVSTFLGGVLLEFFIIIYNATFGMLSAYMTVAISVSYAKLKMDRLSNLFGMAITAIASFLF